MDYKQHALQIKNIERTKRLIKLATEEQRPELIELLQKQVDELDAIENVKRAPRKRQLPNK